MFGLLGKKSILKTGIFEGMVDIHSHILPCVDDGVRSLKNSLEMIDIYKKMGVSKVFCTPHIKASMPQNTKQSLTDSFVEYTQNNLGIELRLAAEYMLDDHFSKFASADGMLSFDGEHVLVEISRRSRLLDIYEMLFGLIVDGYTPILAHPERYLYLTKDDLYAIKDRGVLFQLNIPSLSNYYGKNIGKRAKLLFEDGFYDFAATDFHNEEQFCYIASLCLASREIDKLGAIIQNNSSLWFP